MGGEIMEFVKQPPVVASLIALVGAAIIVPLVKKFYFDTRSRLRVEVRGFRTKTSEGVKKIVGESLDAKQQYFGPIRTVMACNGYAAVTITNISKKKIAGVTATSPRFELVWQLDGANEPVELKQEQLFVVGDIQPKRSQVIHLWCMADVSRFDFGPLKNRLIRISADELDSVRRRFPTPRYVLGKYGFRIAWIIAALSWAVTIGTSIMDALKKV
jgi:hypothetical protein